MERRRTRTLLCAGVVGACLVAASSYVVVAAQRGPEASSPIETARAQTLAAGPHVLFRSLAHDGSNGSVEVAALDRLGARARTGLSCTRVYFAGGAGLCLTPRAGVVPSFTAKIFDRRFRVVRSLGLRGLISRARVSPDGRYGATTAFVTGHSYADVGLFSTQTTLIDMATGKAIADLEQFGVTRNGEAFKARDFNFWGVTFARDSDRFYATLATGGTTYLVRGSVSRRSAVVIHSGVECPSLSPDGTRVAFKKREGSGTQWRLHVLNLRTMRETELAEPRFLDDQAEWLDDGHVVYKTGDQVWVVRADGRGASRRFLSAAESPAVVRMSSAAG